MSFRTPSTPKRAWRYWRNLGGFTLAALVVAWAFLLYVAQPYLLSRGWTHPQRLPVCCVTPADHGLTYEAVSFTTRDGLTLRGWYIPSRNGAAVMMLHGIASNRVGVLDHAVLLARRGYGVLMFDARAHGESEGEVLQFGGDEAEDVRGAANFLQSRPDVDPERIGALGLSLGAQMSILGAARTEAVKAVVADAPCCTTFSDWAPPQTAEEWLYVPFDLTFFQFLRWHTGVSDPLSVRDALAQLSPRPVLIIGGGGAEQRSVEHLFAAAREPKQLWIIPEAGHIAGLSVRPQEYEAKVASFFDEAILGK